MSPHHLLHDPTIARPVGGKMTGFLRAVSFKTVANSSLSAKVVQDDEIFLGFRELLTQGDIAELSRNALKHLIVTVPLQTGGEAFHITATGMKGSGKTYSIGLGVCIDNLLRRFNVSMMMIDPKGEYRFGAALTKDTTPHRMWSTLGMVPRHQPKIKTYRPLACSTSKNEKGTYLIDIEQITVNDLMTLLDIQSQSEEHARHRRALKQAVSQWYEKNDKLHKGTNSLCPPLPEIIENIREGRVVLSESLENLEFDRLVGKDPSKPPPPIIRDIDNGICPCIHTTTDHTLSRRLQGIIQIELEKVINERRVYYDKNIFIDPIYILIDEYNIVASKTRFGFFENIYNQLRDLGIGIIGIGPSLVDFHEVVIKQSDYLICAKIMPNSREERGIKQRLGRDIDITTLTELEETDAQKFPKQFGLINRKGEVETFYPGLSISRHKKKTKRQKYQKVTVPDDKDAIFGEDSFEDGMFMDDEIDEKDGLVEDENIEKKENIPPKVKEVAPKNDEVVESDANEKQLTPDELLQKEKLMIKRELTPHQQKNYWRLRMNDGASPRKMAKDVGISHDAFSKSLRRLKRKGFVEAEGSRSNRKYIFPRAKE